MAKKQKEFFIKGKQTITDPDAPVISNEFVDVREDGTYQGQTIEVSSDTKLEQDTGTGEVFIMRTYEFGANPLMFKDGFPHPQELFNSHMKGIAGMLWQDGLSPATELEPRVIYTPDRKKYLIMVWARPSLGQSVIDTPKTLTEIIHDGRRKDRDSVQRSVPVSTTKKKKTSRAN